MAGSWSCTFISVRATGQLAVAAPASVDDIAIASGGRLVLDIAALVINNGANTIDTFSAWIQSGRNGGLWDGSGIVTSVTSAQGIAPLNTLGIAKASDALLLGSGQTATWNGLSVNASSVLIKYAFAGDANLDGRINGDDYFQIDVGIADHDSDYAHGDFDYNRRIDADDYFIIDRNFVESTATSAPMNSLWFDPKRSTSAPRPRRAARSSIAARNAGRGGRTAPKAPRKGSADCAAAARAKNRSA